MSSWMQRVSQALINCVVQDSSRAIVSATLPWDRVLGCKPPSCCPFLMLRSHSQGGKKILAYLDAGTIDVRNDKVTDTYERRTSCRS